MFETVIGSKTGNRYHTLTQMLHGFGPESNLGYPTHNGIKLFAYEVAHVLHLLVLIGRSFTLHSSSFTLTTMGTFLLHFFIYFYAIFQYILQDTMRHNIGITANRRSKMTIVLKSQTIMPHIARRVFCFRHGANSQLMQHGFFRSALYILNQLIK